MHVISINNKDMTEEVNHLEQIIKNNNNKFVNPLYNRNVSLKDKIENILQITSNCNYIYKNTANVSTQTETENTHLQILENIEKNTKNKKKERITIVYNICAMTGLLFAMSFTFTMMYILWIGFYPPNHLFQSIFFIDRLYDFRDFIQGLRNGSIMQSLADILVKSIELSVRKTMKDMNITIPMSANMSFTSINR